MRDRLRRGEAAWAIGAPPCPMNDHDERVGRRRVVQQATDAHLPHPRVLDDYVKRERRRLVVPGRRTRSGRLRRPEETSPSARELSARRRGRIPKSILQLPSQSNSPSPFTHSPLVYSIFQMCEKVLPQSANQPQMSSAMTFLIASASAFKSFRRVRALAARNSALIFEMDSSIGIEIRRVSE
jgi:hypothetical protein